MFPKVRKPCPSDLKREIRALKKAINKEYRRKDKMRALESELAEHRNILNTLRQVVPPFGEPSFADD